MSMINISGVPNMGFGGGGYFGGIPNVAPAMGAPGDFGASAFSQPQLAANFANFGKQTDYYSGLGAAYGRATGGFGTPGSNPGWQTPAPDSGGQGFNYSGLADFSGAAAAPQSKYFDLGQQLTLPNWNDVSYTPFPSTIYQGFPQFQQPDYSGFNFGGGYNPFDPSIYQSSANFGGIGGSGSRDAMANILMNSASTAYNPFNPAAYQPSAGFGLQNYGGFGASPDLWGAQSGSIGGMDFGGGFHLAPSLYGAGFGGGEAFNALPAYDPNSFANRFAAGGYFGAGTPSQYTYNPYTDASGQTYQPNVPQGFSNGQEAYGPSAIKPPWDPYSAGAGGLGFTGLPYYGGGFGQGFVGAARDQAGNPFIGGSAPAYNYFNPGQGSPFNAGVGMGGLGMTGSGGWGGSFQSQPGWSDFDQSGQKHFFGG